MAKKNPKLPGLESETCPAGRMVEEAAARFNVPWSDMVQVMLYNPVQVTIPVKGGQLLPGDRIPGHLMGTLQPTPEQLPYGPQKSDVMVIMSHPNQMENRHKRYMRGAHGQEFFSACFAANVNPFHWYVTAAVKYEYPMGRTSPLTAWPREELPLIQRELEIVKPKYILAMGAQALEVLFPDKKITNVRGSILQYMDSLVFPTYSPHNIISVPETKAEFYRDIGAFAHLLAGTNPYAKYLVEVELLDTVEKVKAYVDANLHRKVWSVDCEWGGKDPQRGGLRLIQLCCEPGKAAVVHLRRAGWPMPEVMDEKLVVPHLKRLLEPDDRVLIGWFIRSDAVWLEHLGIHVLPGIMRGMDGILAHHALFPTDEQQLELAVNKLIGCQRYDTEVKEWADSHKTSVKRYAYAEVPDELLIPYGAHDVDKTLRGTAVLLKKLTAPGNETRKDLVFNTTMPATQGIFEMERNGFRLDMNQYAMLEDKFLQKSAELLKRIRDTLNWPDFNPKSPQQRIDVLFGSQYHDKKDPQGRPVQLRPANVPCLNLAPVKTTGKPSLYWDEVEDAKKTHLYSPSTDDETLGILAAECPMLQDFRDYAYIEKIVNGFMAEPEKVNGKQVHFDGVRGWVAPDGYIRTHISQLAETGRWRSFDIAMQNWPSQRETDFQRIMGQPNWPSIKSMLVGDVDMPVILESDLKAGEVVGIAFLANDEAALHIMLDPERDIHSEMAIDFFKLKYDPKCGVGTKKWINGMSIPASGVVQKVVAYPELQGGEVWISDKKYDIWPGLQIVVNEGQEVEKGMALTVSHKQLRVAAKSIVFGIPYQRGAKAIAREISQFGVQCEKADAQTYLSTYFRRFPSIEEFLENCKKAVYDPGYLTSVYGRTRWSSIVTDQSAMKGQEREFCNFLVQELVADYMSRATRKFHEAHAWSKYPFRLKLSIHDSMILTCAGEAVPYMCEEVIPRCQAYDNVVPKLGFHFGLEMAASLRLASKPREGELEAVGVPAGYKIRDVEAARVGAATAA